MGSLARCVLYIGIAVVLSACGADEMKLLETQIHEARQQVATAYARRDRLVPELLDAVDWVMSYEQAVLDAVIEAREEGQRLGVAQDLLISPQAVKTFLLAQAQLSVALAELLATTERYPQLRADPFFQSLVTQLQATEHGIAAQHQRYRQRVTQYNDYIEGFPHLITAKILGYERQPVMFDASDPARL